jgi:signal transduction histidine kinase
MIVAIVRKSGAHAHANRTKLHARTAGVRAYKHLRASRCRNDEYNRGNHAATQREAEADGGDYEPNLAAATKSLGDRVEITIRDNGTGIPPNGTGIPPEVKEKIRKHSG